ncbi:patatin-like phospholipase family protein [Pseudoflavonifractor phocaeensis]|uniref:patatin-like phospholipase family protein n=1 Tax=Pseudoflavonifractor phocaeensis TaxID=1870988 RepID=UPI001959D43B|nr:patatin family protein [Pseudoflavonifractor phocaeensis]MBM6884584.1 patatin family protein [Pseudoflavonifractor phocaeensis]
MRTEIKYGLVVEGGGMKCAYNAAILDRFLDEGITFDYCIGVSAGSGNLVSYLAGQRGRNLRFFTEHIHDPEYFGLRSLLKTGDLFGIQHIYGDLTRADGKDPLDFPAFLNNPTEYEAVVTNALTGRPEYFGKEAMKQDDYRLIMASSAIPAVCHPVELNGVPYFDGGLTDAIPVRRALEKGCDRLVVILSKNRDYVKKPQGMRPLYRLACRRYPRIVEALNRRHTVYNQNFQEVFALEQAGTAFVLAPSEPLHVGTYSMKEEAERALYDLGLQDFAAQKENLQNFLSA